MNLVERCMDYYELEDFTQDDAHVFCSEEQLQDEVGRLIDLTFAVYRHFGFNDITVALSTRPEKRVGSDLLWEKAEKIA